MLDNLKRRFPLEVAVSVMRVMMELEVPRLGSEVTVTPKPLDSKKTLVIGIIETFDRSITPGFSNRDEDSLDSQQQTESEDDAKGPRVTIAPTEAKFVVELNKIGHAHSLPAPDQPMGDGLVVLGSLRVKKEAMTVKIHDIEGKESAVVLDITGTHQIRLMNIVASKGIPEIGVRHPFRGIRCFF